MGPGLLMPTVHYVVMNTSFILIHCSLRINDWWN